MWDTLLMCKRKSLLRIFTKDAGFICSANTFQPYVEEIADDVMKWQQSNDQNLLIALVKKMEQLFTVLGNFEQSYSQ